MWQQGASCAWPTCRVWARLPSKGCVVAHGAALATPLVVTKRVEGVVPTNRVCGARSKARLGARRAITGASKTITGGSHALVAASEAITEGSGAIRRALRDITDGCRAITAASEAITEASEAITEAFRAITGERARSVLRTLGAFSDAKRAGRARSVGLGVEMW